MTVEWDEPVQAESAWPAGWVEATAGSIDDPSFVRAPQGEFEDRGALE